MIHKSSEKKKRTSQCDLNGRRMYRSVCLLALFVIVAYGIRKVEPWEVQKCANETGVDLQNKQNYIKKGVPGYKLQCLLTCIEMRSGLLKENGRLDYEALLRQVPLDIPDSIKLIKLLRKCGRLKHGDKCELGYDVQMCTLNLKIWDLWKAVLKAKRAG